MISWLTSIQEARVGCKKNTTLSNRKMSKNRLLLIKYLKKHDTSGNFFSRGLIRMATHEGFIYEFEYFYLKTQIGRHAREKWKSISLFQTLIYRRVNYIHNISVIKTTVNSFS